MFTPNEQPPEKPKNDNNIDDIFSSPSSGTPASPYTPPPQNSGPVDDLFSTSPSNAGGPYVPPPAQPPQRGGNRVLYIILGVVIAFMCICVACIAVAGGSVFAVFQDPTVKASFATGQADFATGRAGFATIQGLVGTGVALGSVPTALPPDAIAKGSLTVAQSQTSTLGAVTRDAWKYEGQGGGKINILAKPQNADLGLSVAIYGINGKLLDNTILLGSNDPGLSVTLPDDGTYTIVVGSLGGIADTNGVYTITVQASR